MNKNIPLYFKLKEDLIEAIESKKYKADDMITSENELCKQYNISRPTVRQAIGELTSMGYLYKIKGKGTFVSDFKNLEIYDHTNGFIFSILDCTDTDSREIIDVTVENGNYKILDKHLSDYFDIEYVPNTDNKFIVAEYFSMQNDKKVFSQSILPARYFPDAVDKLKGNAASFDVIGGKYPYDPMYSKSAVYNVIADDKLSGLLHIPKDSFVLVVESEMISRSGTIVEHNISYYNGMNSRIYFAKGRKR